MPFKFKYTGKLLKTAYNEWNEKDPWRQGAVLAYYAIFSLPALLIVVITIASIFYEKDAVMDNVIGTISETMGKSTAHQMESMLTKAYETEKSAWAVIVGILTIIYGATGIFSQLQKILNIIWEVEAKPSQKGIWRYLKRRIFSFGLVIAVAFLLLISLVISSVLVAISEWLNATEGFLGTIFIGINFLISLGVITLLFALIFKVLPDANIKWRHVWVGSVVTALLFMLGKFALSFYFGKADPSSDYGAAGSIILILLWVSYSSLIVFYGAEFTRAYADLHGEKVKPNEIAEKSDNDMKKWE